MEKCQDDTVEEKPIKRKMGRKWETLKKKPIRDKKETNVMNERRNIDELTNTS